MRLTRGWKRLFLEVLVLVVIVGAAALMVPAEVEAQEDCTSTFVEGHLYSYLDFCLPGATNCGMVTIRCPREV